MLYSKKYYEPDVFEVEEKRNSFMKDMQKQSDDVYSAIFRTLQSAPEDYRSIKAKTLA